MKIYGVQSSNINSLLYSFIHFVKLILVNNCISNKLFIVFDIQHNFLKQSIEVSWLKLSSIQSASLIFISNMQNATVEYELLQHF